jgi:hypothetical protein
MDTHHFWLRSLKNAVERAFLRGPADASQSEIKTNLPNERGSRECVVERTQVARARLLGECRVKTYC